MIRMIAAVRPDRPDFTFLTGWDAALMPLLLVGADGGTNASSGVVPELTRRLYELTTAPGLNAERLEQARALQYDLRDAVRRDDRARRVPGGLPRPPPNCGASTWAGAGSR